MEEGEEERETETDRGLAKTPSHSCNRELE